MEGATIGSDCNLCDHVFVEGGARIGDRVTVKNGVMIWDGVTIAQRYGSAENWLTPTTVGRGATIGAGAIIVCGLAIGRYASVAAGAIVTRDVPDHRLVLGRPARIAGWVCLCGAPLDNDLACALCNRRYRVGEDTIEPG
jgi:acetyltransferase-like isoleucine patch superfamily enzyme